jgi:hypothetical protein
MKFFLPGTLAYIPTRRDTFNVWSFRHGVKQFIIDDSWIILIISHADYPNQTWIDYVLCLCNNCVVEINSDYLGILE